MPISRKELEDKGTTHTSTGKSTFSKRTPNFDAKGILIRKDPVKSYNGPGWTQQKFHCVVKVGYKEYHLMCHPVFYDAAEPGDKIFFAGIRQSKGDNWVKIYKYHEFRILEKDAAVVGDEFEFVSNYVTKVKQKGDRRYRWAFDVFFSTISGVNRVYIDENALHEYLKIEPAQESPEIEESDEIPYGYDNFYYDPCDEHERGSFSEWKVIGNHQGEVFFVNKVLSIKEKTVSIGRHVPVSELTFGYDNVTYKTQDATIVVSTPFPCTPMLNKIRDKLTGEVLIEGILKKTGRFNWQEKKVESWWEPKQANIKWNDEVLEKIEGLREVMIKETRYDELLRKLHSFKEFSISTASVMFGEEGLQLQQEDIDGLIQKFWKKDYDAEYFKALNDLDPNDIYLTKDFFIFNFGDKVVIERPVYGAATYVFENPGDPAELAAAFREIPKYDIRYTEEISKALGYVGFVIHDYVSGWISIVKRMMK